MNLRALSLWQPYATLILISAKIFETRHWNLTYRGPLVIHAAKSKDGLEVCEREPFKSILAAAGYGQAADLPFGAIVGMVEVVDCQIMTATLIASISAQERAFGYWEPGRFAIQTANPQRLVKPIPFRGAQGLFPVNSALLFGAEFDRPSDAR